MAATPATAAGVLAGKIAIITGAAQGIGLAIAELFHAQGASLVLADISGDQNAVAVRLGTRVLAQHCDVSKDAEVRALVEAAVQHFGGLDILVNNAGIDGEMRPLAEVDDAQFDHIIAVNLRGVFLGTRYSIPALLARGGGSIINIASVAGITGVPGLGPYGAAKAGVIQLTRSTAVEYSRQKIRANAICPGMIATDLTKALLVSHPQAGERVVATTPAGRVGEVDEVARVALFLASDEASYVTGASLPVDGGYTVL